jgi:hypothetical protein
MLAGCIALLLTEPTAACVLGVADATFDTVTLLGCLQRLAAAFFSHPYLQPVADSSNPNRVSRDRTGPAAPYDERLAEATSSLGVGTLSPNRTP